MKKKKILAILYGFLLLAVLVLIFCIVMIVKTGKQEEGMQSELRIEDSLITNEQTVSGQNVSGEDAGASALKDETLDTDGKEKEAQSEDKTVREAFDSQLTGSGQLKEIELEISGVPVIVYVTDTKEEKPLLILQHGLTSKKEDMKDLAVNLAGLSYVVVTPDAAGHGELESKEELALAELTERTAENFDKVIAYFEESAYADIERTGIMGLSLGGISAFYHAANGVYQPKVLVSLCATPDYKDLTKSHVIYEIYKNGKEEVIKDKAKQKELEELIVSKSPYEKLLQNKETCFYLLCGKEDETVPHEGNIRFYEEMKESAKDIVLSVKENQKHEVTEEDLIKALEYLKGHL